jgi:outer membrane protein OmpA-like peptidoglycan-associated protein
LKEGFENYFESPGPGKCFSKPLQVKKGERQILVVDNIYSGGGGFDLQISLKYKAEETGILEGTIKDKITGAPLRSVVIVEDDSTGTFLTKTTSDNIGNYKVEIPLKTRLNIVVQHPDYLFQTTDIISAQHLAAQDFLLDKIAAGNKLILYNIHFSPNKDAVLPASDAELGRLINFLKDQQQWSIKLVGHTNNNVFASARYLQQLSFNRAIAVKKLLLQNGIPEKRISCAGMGGKYPVADSKDPVEGLKNLRVEVLLTAK